jgi:hypothetical protein
MIEVLDNPPIALGERVSFQTRGIGGNATARVRLAFPLDGPHGFGNLGLRGTARSPTRRSRQLAAEWDVTGANATVAMDERGLRIDGTAMARSVPVTVQFRHQFARRGRRRSTCGVGSTTRSAPSWASTRAAS